MHIKSILAYKNMNPIFIDLYYLALPRKNARGRKRSNMPLGKLQMSKLCLFISGKSTDPKKLKIYQYISYVICSSP